MDQYFMRVALRQAKRGGCFVSPNPKVGCIIVKNGCIIGRGYHRRWGAAHAEVEALLQARTDARGATLYVNLEPCCHYGRTPPCTEAIIQAGIRRVVYSLDDPDNRVAGQGCKQLIKAGIVVEKGLCATQAAWLNRAYLKHRLTGKPYVTYKMAMTLDGKTATRTGEAHWISCPSSRAFVHKMRREIGNVMVGGQTAVDDNPRLTARGKGFEFINLRIVVAGGTVLAKDSNLLAPGPHQTLLFASRDQLEHYHRLPENVAVEFLPSQEGEIDLQDVLHNLGSRGLNHILCEGGANLGGSLFRQKMIDELVVFVAPKIMGDDMGKSILQGLHNSNVAQMQSVKIKKVQKIGSDYMFIVLPEGRENVYGLD